MVPGTLSEPGSAPSCCAGSSVTPAPLTDCLVHANHPPSQGRVRSSRPSVRPPPARLHRGVRPRLQHQALIGRCGCRAPRKRQQQGRGRRSHACHAIHRRPATRSPWLPSPPPPPPPPPPPWTQLVLMRSRTLVLRPPCPQVSSTSTLARKSWRGSWAWRRTMRTWKRCGSRCGRPRTSGRARDLARTAPCTGGVWMPHHVAVVVSRAVGRCTASPAVAAAAGWARQPSTHPSTHTAPASLASRGLAGCWHGPGPESTPAVCACAGVQQLHRVSGRHRQRRQPGAAHLPPSRPCHTHTPPGPGTPPPFRTAPPPGGTGCPG